MEDACLETVANVVMVRVATIQYPTTKPQTLRYICTRPISMSGRHRIRARFSEQKERAMELEVACAYRMREILLDLSAALGDAPSVARSATAVRETESETDVDAWAADFAKRLVAVCDIVNNRVKVTPSEKRAREKYLRTAATGLEDARDRIQGIKDSLAEKKSEHQKLVDAISTEIGIENVLLEEIKSSHAVEITRLIRESEDEASKIEEETDSTLELLRAEIISNEARLEGSLKAKNMSNEKELYRIRSEIEVEYLAVLKKYDNDVGALYRTMESLTERSNRLDEKFRDFQQALALQEIRYVELRDERELAQLKAFTEDLENFSKNRAAKIIQRFWRGYYERWCIRRKKKGKKKKC